MREVRKGRIQEASMKKQIFTEFFKELAISVAILIVLALITEYLLGHWLG